MSGSNGNGASAVIEKPPVGTPVIRLATDMDFPEVVAGIVAMRQDTIWQFIDFEYNPANVLKWLMRELSTNPAQRLVVAELDGQIIGLCGGELITMKFVPDVWILQEWAWWVQPAARKTFPGLGWKMWTELMTWARTAGAKGAVYGKTLPVPDLKLPRAFEKWVFVPLCRLGPQEAT